MGKSFQGNITQNSWLDVIILERQVRVEEIYKFRVYGCNKVLKLQPDLGAKNQQASQSYQRLQVYYGW